ncbi:MAG: hypothetical protein R3F46_14015 [bacterium]
MELEEDGFTIHGPKPLHGCQVQCAGDLPIDDGHGMAALIANGEARCTAWTRSANYPGFFSDLQRLLNGQ